MIKKILFFVAVVFPFLNIKADNLKTNSSEVVSLGTSSSYEIAEEITKLKESDPFIKKYLSIKDPEVKLFLEQIQRAGLMAKLEYEELEQIKFNFIYISPDPFFENFVNPSQATAPKLYALIQDLSKELKIRMPYIFISFDEDSYNACALTYSKNLTSIIIGEEMIKGMPDNQFRTIIAHELGHLVNDTKNKVSCLDRFIKSSHLDIVSAVSFFSLTISVNLLTRPSTYKFIKNNPLLSTLIGLGLSAPIIWELILFFTILKKEHTPADEVNADKFAIDLTKDPEAFIAAMENLKTKHIKDFGDIKEEFIFVDEALEGLKGLSTSLYDRCKKNILQAKNDLEYLQKRMLDSGGDSHPGINSRIEFGKQELNKLKQQKLVN